MQFHALSQGKQSRGRQKLSALKKKKILHYVKTFGNLFQQIVYQCECVCLRPSPVFFPPTWHILAPPTNHLTDATQAERKHGCKGCAANFKSIPHKYNACNHEEKGTSSPIHAARICTHLRHIHCAVSEIKTANNSATSAIAFVSPKAWGIIYHS